MLLVSSLGWVIPDLSGSSDALLEDPACALRRSHQEDRRGDARRIVKYWKFVSLYAYGEWIGSAPAPGSEHIADFSCACS
jgi:hypothetical protein